MAIGKWSMYISAVLFLIIGIPVTYVIGRQFMRSLGIDA